MKVFVDADAFVGLTIPTDAYHKTAVSLVKVLKDKKAQLFTSSDVLKEAATVISQKASHEAAIEFLRKITSGEVDITVIFVNEKVNQRGVEIFIQQMSKNVSVFDCTSFAVMEKYKIEHAFSFDKHFKGKRISSKISSKIGT